jgi:hypothetical protein
MRAPLLVELDDAFGYPGEQVDYLCNIGKQHAFMYFETPKVACSSIKRTLQQLELGSHGAPAGNVHDKRVSALYGAVSSGWSLERIFRSSELFRFAFVRNPYARILSCYLEKIVQDEIERRRHQHWLGFEQREPVSFLNFLQAIDRIPERDRDIHWKSQAATINDRFIHYHFIGRFEHLDRDFPVALSEMGVRSHAPALQDINHHKTNARSRLQEFYGATELELARRIYRQDFIRYGYTYDLPA